MSIRSDYRAMRAIPTRWMDNDAYGHVNNVVYYSWFDTAVNVWLIDAGLLDIHHGNPIGLVVETGCRYHRAVAFPDLVEAQIRIAKLGNSSVRWEVGLFTAGHEGPAAEGHFVHVYVDRETRRPLALPETWRAALAPLVVASDAPAA
ncbi:thioesterase family protein [Sandarakinorhabdus sp.]|uniref:acyl-CoA thioesterase n=1 Tax=Sandarakinorhabdus sp. TaxID=1916663 RepID=UPI00333EB1F7